jgi:hypothetical protein
MICKYDVATAVSPLISTRGNPAKWHRPLAIAAWCSGVFTIAAIASLPVAPLPPPRSISASVVNASR